MVYQVLTSARFMALWMLGSILVLIISGFAALLATMILSIVLGYFYVSNSNPANPTMHGLVILGFGLVGSIFGLAWGSAQKYVMTQKYRAQFRWWRRLSTLGGGLGFALSAVALSVPIKRMLLTLTLPDARIFLFYGVIPIVIPLACMAIGQWFVLNRYVYGAWTWLLANVVAGLVVYALLLGLISSGIAVLIVPALFVATTPAIVTGFALLWLFFFNARGTWPDAFY